MIPLRAFFTSFDSRRFELAAFDPRPASPRVNVIVLLAHRDEHAQEIDCRNLCS
jgi:hypothetical protein